jgi:hypothetical protein
MKIHQGDVGAMAPEFGDCLRGSACLSDHQHVGLQTDDRLQSFTNDRMILDASMAQAHAIRILLLKRQQCGCRNSYSWCVAKTGVRV